MRNLGSLVRVESSYSNEQDPWENEVPMSFQSTRRESRAKPPGSTRNPRAFTLPNLLSLRSHMRNRSNDSEYVPYSPVFSRAPPVSSPRSVAAERERVVQAGNMTEETSPAIMARSFIRPSNRRGGPPMDAGGVIKNDHDTGAAITQIQQMANARESTDSDTKTKKLKVKRRGAEEVVGISPVSDEADEEERSPRRNWIRERVARVLRLRRRERTHF